MAQHSVSPDLTNAEPLQLPQAALQLLAPPRAALGRSTAEDTADGRAYKKNETDPSVPRQNEQ